MQFNNQKIVFESMINPLLAQSMRFNKIDLDISLLNRLLLLLLIFTASIPLSLASDAEPEAYWQGSLGPLNIRSLAPGQALRMAPLPRSPYGLIKGETELQFHVAGASVYLNDPGKYFIDFNFTDTRIALRHGFLKGWSAELGFNDRRIVNLYLDGVVKKFHEALDIDQNGRDVNLNETHLIVPEYSLNFSNELNGIFSQSIDLSIQKVIVDKSVEWPAVAMSFNSSIETLSNGMIEKGAVDYGIQISLAQKKQSGYLFGNLSYSIFGSNRALAVVPLAKTQLSGMLGYEFKTVANQALIVQYLFSDGVINNLAALDRVSHEIHLGYKWRHQLNIIELGVVENIINIDNGPDVAFTFGITHRI